MKKNKPEVRFKGFQGEWSEKYFHEIIDLKSGRDYKHLSLGAIPVYGTGGYMLSVNDALSYREDAIGIGRKGTIDKPFILKAPFWTVDTLFFALPRENFNLEFVFKIFQKINWKQKDESTGVPSLSKVAINNITHYVAKPEEQTQIGNFFQNIDQLISLHQKKYDKLVILKKAMLEKMFPKPGAKVPEIRFKGFEGDWKEKRLGDIYHFQYGHFNVNPSDGGQYPVYGANGIIGGYSKYNAENSVIIGHMGEYAGSVIWCEGKHFVTYNGTISYPKSSEIIPKFGFQMLFQKDIRKICGGSGQPFLSYDTLQKINCTFPKSPDEQIKIGNYFQNLDSLISLNQKQLEKLKNIKKACLEKMFV